MKAGEKLVSTILAASTACQESRLGTISGKGYYAPNVRADGFGATHFSTWTSAEEMHEQRGAGNFARKIHCMKLLE